MSNRKTLFDLIEPTFSPGSAGGNMRFGLLAGRWAGLYGQEVVPVNRSLQQARDGGPPTLAIYGPTFADSSPTADLQSSLENRLRARLDVNGSLEYALTWKHWDMSSGVPICALRASGRRTSDNACSGWPTPDTSARGADTADPSEGTRPSGHWRAFTLQRAAWLAGWPSPTASDDTGGSIPPSHADRESPCHLKQTAMLAGWPTPQCCEAPNNSTNRGEGQHRPRMTPQNVQDLVGWPTPTASMLTEQDLAQALTSAASEARAPYQSSRLIAGWPTPMAGTPATEDYNAAGNNDSSRKTVGLVAGWVTPMATDNKATSGGRGREANPSLRVQATLAGWATPNTRDAKTDIPPDQWERDGQGQPLSRPVLGIDSTSSPAETENLGALNPAHSRWLMGYPIEWDECAAMVMP